MDWRSRVIPRRPADKERGGLTHRRTRRVASARPIGAANRRTPEFRTRRLIARAETRPSYHKSPAPRLPSRRRAGSASSTNKGGIKVAVPTRQPRKMESPLRPARYSSMEPVRRPSRHSAAPAPTASPAQAALARKLSLRCPSPLPRVEAFTGAAPPACRALPASSGALSRNSSVNAAPSRNSSAKVAPSPGSSVTAGSNSVSPSSSAASAASASAPVPDAPAVGVSPSGLLRRRTASRDTRGRETSVITLPGAPPAPDPPQPEEARDFGVFEEDDFTDRFDSVNLNFDRDAALDEYVVFSRRYDGNVKMRAEVKEALPRKRVPGGGLWERLYSDVSMQFGANARDATRADVARRALSSGDIGFRSVRSQKSGTKHGMQPKPPSTARPEPRAKLAARTRSSPHGGRGGRRKFAAAESSRTNRDDFLEFQGLYTRTARKVREAPRLLGGVKSFFRGLVGRRRGPNPEFARSYAQ